MLDIFIATSKKSIDMKILHELRETMASTLPYFELKVDQYEQSYAPGKWTIKEILVHIVDAETVLYDRLRRVIAGPKQVVWAFDQDAWCKNLNYQTYPLSLAKAQYQATRSNVIYLATMHYEEHGERQWVHSETGLRTLRDEFDKIAWHNQHHLDQIELALFGSNEEDRIRDL